MRTFVEEYLGGFAIEEEIYKVDLAVLDRYQSFSAELLRLALLAIAGYGFLMSTIVFAVKKNGKLVYLDPFLTHGWLLLLGAAALIVAAGTALFHRYFSTDCLAHFVRRIRLIKKAGTASADEQVTLQGTIDQENLSLQKDLDICGHLLLWASGSLVAGVALFAAGACMLLFALRTD